MSGKPVVALLTNNDDDVFCFRLELIRSILSNGYQLLISCPDGPKFEVLDEEYGLRKNRDFLYDDLDIDRRGTNVAKDVKLVWHYYRLFCRVRPSVILTYTAKPNVYATLVAKMLRIPTICNVTGFGSALYGDGFKQKLIMGLFKTAYRSASYIMFQNSTNMKKAIDLGWVKNECRLIPGSGVALERYPAAPYPNGGDGVSGETVVFNYIGRILHDKGVDDYIEAAKRIKSRFPRTEFNLLGFIEPTESHYEEELAELERQDIVHYRGSQKDVRPWIERSHAIIHPSTYGEGMSNVLLENASSARPIITTDNPGCRETVDDGISGFLYHGGNVDQLVDRIELFLSEVPNSVRRQMGLEGRKKVEKEFDRNIVINAYLEEIKALIAEGKR